MDVMPNANFMPSSKNKDWPRVVNQKVITAINNLDGFTLGDNLITSQQVDYISSALVQAEAVENNQEYLLANKVDSITLLVTVCA